MLFGGSIASAYDTPESWAVLLKASRFAATTCPVDHRSPPEQTRAYLDEARRLDVTIAEVGVWKNPLSPDAAERKRALEYAQNQLAFADEIGVRCCVNIVGSRGEVWDGAYADNYAPDTYDAIVASIREILDAVRPKRCYYTIEPMPWMVPDGPDEYLQLIQDVDRPMFGAHLDFVNMINSPKRFLFAGDFIDECVKKLGPHIISIHAKDIALERPFTALLRELPPGQGALDYARLLRTIHRALPQDMPVLLEHMDNDADYAKAYDYVAGIAQAEQIPTR